MAVRLMAVRLVAVRLVGGKEADGGGEVVARMMKLAMMKLSQG